MSGNEPRSSSARGFAAGYVEIAGEALEHLGTRDLALVWPSQRLDQRVPISVFGIERASDRSKSSMPELAMTGRITQVGRAG